MLLLYSEYHLLPPPTYSVIALDQKLILNSPPAHLNARNANSANPARPTCAVRSAQPKERVSCQMAPRASSARAKISSISWAHPPFHSSPSSPTSPSWPSPRTHPWTERVCSVAESPPGTEPPSRRQRWRKAPRLPSLAPAASVSPSRKVR